MTTTAGDKPSVHGLKDSRGWFYVAECSKCDWSFNWDGAVRDWLYIANTAWWHYWMYSETKACRSG